MSIDVAESNEDRIAKLEKTQKEILEQVAKINSNTEDLLFIFNGAKAGATFILFLGVVAKWVGGVSVAFIAIWALYRGWQTGSPPNVAIE